MDERENEMQLPSILSPIGRYSQGTWYPRNGGGHRAFWRCPTAQHNRHGGEYNKRDQRHTDSHGGAVADTSMCRRADGKPA